jgi:hypothetical protein
MKAIIWQMALAVFPSLTGNASNTQARTALRDGLNVARKQASLFGIAAKMEGC